MRVHYLQHVPFEGLGSIEAALAKRDCTLSATKLYKGDPLPADQSFDWLIVMGGPMGVYDTDAYPWLETEKKFIARAIGNGKTVLGICLGAQLIAASLGETIHKNGTPEIGWFDIEPTAEARSTILGPVFSGRTPVFHWHGDTFDLPKGATLLATSRACDNQAFIMDDRVVGLQFHLETTILSASALINNCAHELIPGSYVQTADEIMAITNRFTHVNQKMDILIGRLYEQTARQCMA